MRPKRIRSSRYTFAAPVKPGGQKKDECKDGISCGLACISRKKVCRKNLATEKAIELAGRYGAAVRNISGIAGSASSSSILDVAANQGKGDKKPQSTTPLLGTRPDGRKMKSGPITGKRPAYGQHEFHKERRRVSEQEYIEKYGEERVKNFNEALRRKLKEYTPIVYIDKEIVERVKQETDPNERRLKSVHEVGGNKLEPDDREQYMEDRRTYEQQIVGYDKDVPDDERPIYATLQRKDNRTPLTMYGDTGYEIDAKDDSYTITLGDSLTAHAPGAADIKEVGLAQFSDDIELFDDVIGWEIGDMEPNASKEEWDDLAQSVLDQIEDEWNYLEIQIHQKVDIDKLKELD